MNLEEKTLERIDSRLSALEEASRTRKQADEEFIEMFNAMKGFMTVMGWFERFSIWLTKVGAGIAIIWAVVKFAILDYLNTGAGK